MPILYTTEEQIDYIYKTNFSVYLNDSIPKYYRISRPNIVAVEVSLQHFKNKQRTCIAVWKTSFIYKEPDYIVWI